MDYDDFIDDYAQPDLEPHFVEPNCISSTPKRTISHRNPFHDSNIPLSDFSAHSSPSPDYSFIHSESLVPLDTPPLTPESTNSRFLDSSDEDFHDACDYSPSDFIFLSAASEDTIPSPHALEIRAGKKPESPICFDTLIDDISGQNSTELSPLAELAPPLEPAALDDSREWYGLEYTLELSCRERRASECIDSCSAGEHSKSRQSWAVMHLGTVDPYFEEEAYRCWRKWHRYLDHQEERRKHRKAFDFLKQSEEMSWCYMNEMKIRDYLAFQTEYGESTSEQLKDQLSLMTSYRPDPYNPSRKHNQAWRLKRSRSVCCLRELVPKL